MSIAFNQCTFAGFLTRDIEIRATQSGDPVANSGVAVNSGSKDRPETMFIDVTVFGKTAEAFAKVCAKGTPVIVSGRLRQDQWEKDGVRKSKHVLIVGTWQVLSQRDEGAKKPPDIKNLPPFRPMPKQQEQEAGPDYGDIPF